MKHDHPTASPYRERTVECSECRGSGRAYRDYYDRGSECFDCSGTGEWTALCADCGEARPLNDNGICESCSLIIEADVVDMGGGRWGVML